MQDPEPEDAQSVSSVQVTVQVPHTHSSSPQSADVSQCESQFVWLPVCGAPGEQADAAANVAQTRLQKNVFRMLMKVGPR
jgi:hypothetical protein